MGYNFSHSVISGHPPLLVFTVCLTAFGLTMVILAYVVGEQDVPNPDVQMDWNKFFKQMSQFKLCPPQNHSKTFKDKTTHNAVYTTDSVLNVSSHVVDQSRSLSAVLSDVVHYASDESYDEIEYTDISAKIQLKLIGKAHLSPYFKVDGRIKGILLGFTGKYGSLLFNISLNFLSHGNVSCSDGNCESLWDVCVVMSVPSDLLLETKNPDRCDNWIVSSPGFVPPFVLDVRDAYKNYLSSPCLAMDYTPNSKLTEMLSLHDRSIVNLHLMHTSYFMFVMVMTLICYSLIKGRYRLPKNSHSLEKGLLDT